MKNTIPAKSPGLSLLLWTTAFSISLLFNPLAANAQITGNTPTDTLDPEVRSRTSARTQGVTYFNEYYKSATATNYTYKRVIKYERPEMDPNLFTVYMNGLPHVTINPVQTGIHYCSLVDYYRTGEIAREARLVSTNKTCSQSAFDGKEILYYKNGRVKQEATYYIGELHGRLIEYDEAGNQVRREDYDHGVRIEENRLIIGTWKYNWYFVVQQNYAGVTVPRTVGVNSTVTYSKDNSVEASHITGSGISKFKGNWKYIPKDVSSGILEEYQGEDLVGKLTVKWLSRDQFECTVTFSKNSDLVGKQFVLMRQ